MPSPSCIALVGFRIEPRASIWPAPCRATAEVASAPRPALGRPSLVSERPAAANDPPEPGTSHERGENREHHEGRVERLGDDLRIEGDGPKHDAGASARVQGDGEVPR